MAVYLFYSLSANKGKAGHGGDMLNTPPPILGLPKDPICTFQVLLETADKLL
jgi:hypothetical protein